MTNLYELTALQQAEKLATGEISSRELIEQYLDRIAAYDTQVGAFITVTADAALEKADEVDRARRAGAELPRFAGVPTAVKDLVATAGVPTTYGSAALKDFVPALDAHVVTLMKNAGLISLGKTNTAEFGLTPYTATTVGGSARTPWDLARTAGGSSGGSAAAVAAGLVPFAHGNDGGGSLRIPAAVCGVVGFKPSRGRISNGPLADDPTMLLCQGPMSRTVADAAVLLDIMAAPIATDPYLAAAQRSSFHSATEREPGRMRIAAYIDTPFAPEADPEVIEAFNKTVTQLEALGHEVVMIECPFQGDTLDAFITSWAVRSLRIPVPAEAEAGLLPITRWWREQGRKVSAEAFLNALVTMQTRAREALAATADFDFILTPSLALRPPREEFFTEASAEELVSRSNSFSPYAAAFSTTGQPSVSLPLHTEATGLPIGIMLTAQPGNDAGLFTLAAQLEAAYPWATRWPNLTK